jgi:anthranilate phosphoribosyltransferase
VNAAEALRAVQAGATLEADQSAAVFRDVLRGEVEPVLLGGLLAALATRRETVAELTGAARAMRGAMVPFEHDCPDAIDTCGTGGDGLGTFNLSTAAALVAAAAGARVIKHGNRAATSRSGSADLLEAVGVRLELTPAAAREVLEQVGITYLHAPLYHPAMRHAGPVRRTLGIRTAFNLLGPLCNPGGVQRQLIGVADPTRREELAAILEELGTRRAMVVHGAGGADELTLEGENALSFAGDLGRFEADGRRLGLDAAPVTALGGGDAAANASLLRRLLDGDGGPLRDALLYNAAAALVLAGTAHDALDGVQRAAEAVDSGAARDRLAQWAALTEALAA